MVSSNKGCAFVITIKVVVNLAGEEMKAGPHPAVAGWATGPGSKKKAIVAVARKLVVRMHTVEVTGQPYVIGVER